ncbi:MAG: TRAP transporter substrate-binding protein [Burkholderiales bacterium]|nr:TRAP transporter substrate-binding protein [Burkholderiales bacterium]MDP2399045.1 TRAP transporter substrate-binding protein [Burkholderiales bacterium]
MPPVTFRLGGYQKPASIHTRACLRFGEVLQREAGDAVRFEFVPDVLSLGHKSGELPLMVERGELSACYISSLRFSKWVPELALFDLPFLFPGRAAAYKVLDGRLGLSLKDKVAAQSPFRLLAYWDNGFRHFSNKLRPIRKPADCKGIRIRIQMSELQAESLRLLGMEPILEDIKIFVEQIGGDRFDAQDNPLTNIVNFNIHKHHRYITLSGHVYGVACLMANRSQYESWPAAVQRAAAIAATEATAYQRQLAAAEDEEMLIRLDPAQNEVVQLTAEEHRAFAEAVMPVTEKYRKDYSDSFFALLD